MRQPAIQIEREYTPDLSRQVRAILALLSHPAAVEPSRAEPCEISEPIAAAHEARR
jgi:hypothetical protein